MKTYSIETICNLFTGNAHAYLLERIAQSSPDFFTEEDLETASSIEEGIYNWQPDTENPETEDYNPIYN